ncbi:MAG TPA: hypothetical protein PK609_03775 [Candidatus Paceibacterota bacterium]|nr:hypothetical protein [Candidatus Paceibacterota bacterium]
MPPVESGNQEIKTLLEENIAVTKENNRLLREMRRNAILGLIAKVVIWLVILGVPLFFLSTYLGPLLETVSGQEGGGQLPAGLFGVPNEEQVQQILDLYRTEYQ